MTKESTIQRNVVRLIITRGGHAIVTRPSPHESLKILPRIA
jgi:hypothetical protein